MRSIIGKKRKFGWGIDWSNELVDELHKHIRRKFKKRRIFAYGADAIWAADLVEMQSSRSNKAFQHLWKIQTPPQKLWTHKVK